MYLHLGQDIVVRTSDIIGIFDLDITTTSRKTRDFLTKCEKDGVVINVSDELPKSFVICKSKYDMRHKVYISQISPATLLKRTNFIKELSL